ncbi:MAG TPA: type II secretion system F family protein [Anaerolineaceae bacterium]|nr:type II secretion system F family protein [Anaerolineaceae bacterium]
MDLNLILVGVGGLAGIFLLVGIIVSLTGERTLVEERLGRYVEEEKASNTPANQPASTPITDWFNRRVEKSSFGDNIAKELARADLKFKPAEYIALMIIAAILVGFIAWYLGGKYLIVGLLGAVFGLFLPRMYVRREQSRRLVRFNEQLGDMLNLMVNGLRAGYSTMQAMEAVSRELPAPISDEFRRVVQEMQLGLPMERALDNLLRRIPSEDLDLVITAINVQREVGGNLAEILDTISYTIRERVRIKGEIRVLTAQVMMSGRFLSLLPVFVCLILWFLNREYMMEFFKPENGICGYIALAVGAINIIIGYFVMNKIGDIEV